MRVVGFNQSTLRSLCGVLCCLGLGCQPAAPVAPSSTVPATTVPATTTSQSEATSAAAPQPSSATTRPPSAQSPAAPHFTDVADELGVRFTYNNGANGKVLMVEATGGGGGWLDFDRDGQLDLYLGQAGDPVSATPEQEPSDQLWRQSPAGQFLDISLAARIEERKYGQGVSAADHNDDGFDDIFVTNAGLDTLFLNQGDGTFLDVSLAAGVSDPRWSSSAAWGDLNADGNLDLYVCNYVDYDPFHPIPCGSNGRPGTCHPGSVPPVPDECYFSQGDGTFRPESVQRGLVGPGNRGLGVVIADFNNDGSPDVYVANDTTANFLFINDGRGMFTESAYELGCAVSREGHPQASMGIAVGDYDSNGWLDLCCSHFSRESNTLYKNLGSTGFQDVTGIVGLHAPTYDNLGFGTLMEDFNQDGRMDLMVVNGHIDDWRYKGDLYEMEPQLFCWNGSRFVEKTAECGPYFQGKRISRGLAKGDYDNDGDWDLLVVSQNTPTAILRNDSQRGHWMKLRLQARGNRSGWGTRVTLTSQSPPLMQELVGGSSYAATHESALIFGLGTHDQPVDVEIRWPDGAIQKISGLPVDREILLQQSAAPARGVES